MAMACGGWRCSDRCGSTVFDRSVSVWLCPTDLTLRPGNQIDTTVPLSHELISPALLQSTCATLTYSGPWAKERSGRHGGDGHGDRKSSI